MAQQNQADSDSSEHPHHKSVIDDENALSLPAIELLPLILEDQRNQIPTSSDPVRVEEYLQKFPGLKDNPEFVLDLIYNEFLLDCETSAASNQAEPKTEDYLRRFPNYATALQSQFQVCLGLFSDSNEEGFASPGGSAFAKETSREFRLESSLINSRFEIVEKLGQGGFAVVYKAWDQKLKRFVAIKLARFEMQPDSKQYQRFAREAESVAKLSHPGILPVFEIGKENGHPFIVAQLADGGTLAERLNESSVSPLEAAQWLLEICEAVEYAHRFGVIHRDIKPANILFNDGVPCITDFGLAAVSDEQLNITVHGDLIGTPAFMSPEQAKCVPNITAASDLYSLGVVMYQLLAGCLPFSGTPSQVLHQTVSAKPTAPRIHNKRVPIDLQNICLKAMAKSPSHRYSSAREMADDIRRFLDHEPVKARPIGVFGHSVRWCMRQPALAITILAAFVLVATISIISVGRISQERNLFRHERDRANIQLYHALINSAENEYASKTNGWFQRAYDAVVEAAGIDENDGDSKRLRELMIKLLVDTGVRLEATDSSEHFHCRITAVARNATGEFVVAATENGDVVVLSQDLKDQRAEFVVPNGERPVFTDLVVWEKSQLVFGLANHQLWMWDIRTLGFDEQANSKRVGKLVAESVSSVALSYDNSIFALSNPDGVQLFRPSLDSELGKDDRYLQFPVGETKVECMSFSKSEDKIYLGLEDTTLQCRSTRNGQLVAAAKNAREPVRHVAAWGEGAVWSDQSSFSLSFWKPDSDAMTDTDFLSGSVTSVMNIDRWPACATKDGIIHMFEFGPRNPKVVAQAQGFGELECVSINHNEGGLLVGYSNGRIQRWEIVRSNVARDWHSYQPVAVSVDDKLISSTGVEEFDGTSKVDFALPLIHSTCIDRLTGDLYCAQKASLYSLERLTGNVVRKYDAHPTKILDIAFDAKNNELVVLGLDGHIQRRSSGDLEWLSDFHVSDASVRQIAAHGNIIVLCGDSGVVAFHQDDPIHPCWTISRSLGDTLASNGELLVVQGAQNDAVLYEFATGKKIGSLIGHSGVIESAKFIRGDTAEIDQLVTISTDQTLRFWDLEKRKEIRRIETTDNADSFAIDPLGTFAITRARGEGSDMVLLDLKTGKRLARLEMTGPPATAVFSRDGQHVWVCGNGVVTFERSVLSEALNRRSSQQQVLLDIKNQYQYIIPGRSQLYVWSVDVSPDNRWIATTSHDGCIRIFDFGLGKLRHFLSEHDGIVWSCDFSEDSKWLATGSQRGDVGEIIIWDTETWQAVKRIHVGHQLISGLDFHPSRPWIAVSSFDGSAWLLDYESGKIVQELLPAGGRTMDIDFSPRGDYLAAARTSLGVTVWGIEAGADGASANNGVAQLVGNIQDSQERFWTVAFTHDQQSLVTATQSGIVNLHEFPSLDPIVAIETGANGFRQIGVSTDDQYIAVSAWPSPPAQVINLHRLRAHLRKLGLDWSSPNQAGD